MTPSETIAKTRELLNGILHQTESGGSIHNIPKIRESTRESLSLLDGLERKEVVITEDCYCQCRHMAAFRWNFCSNCGASITWKLEATHG